jgi:hypothetical protein
VAKIGIGLSRPLRGLAALLLRKAMPITQIKPMTISRDDPFFRIY